VTSNAHACLRWLARKSPDLEAVRGALQDIATNGQRASDIITRIRAVLKKAPTHVLRLDINRVIMDVVKLTRREVQRHKVLLRTDLTAALPLVLGDRVQLQQVLLNLVLNGIEAMHPVTDRRRVLLIRSARAAGRVRVAVQDTGSGFDPQTLKRIFDAFYTTKPTGMGMGLAISRTIIAAHGGRLWAERNPDHGATMQFSLPIAEEDKDD
jgi:signal transduction histidine kinase